MSELALLPCPFCGGDAMLDEYEGEHYVSYYPRCPECEAMADGTRTKAEAIAAWNKRTPTEWQDFESAPKNRKVLVAYRNKLGNWRIVVGCYHTHLDWSDDEAGQHDEEYAPEGWYEESDNNETIWPTNCPPTHWRELPAPPASRNGEGRT